MDEVTVPIRNMVCNRCILAVTDIFRRAGIEPLRVELGGVTLAEAPAAEVRARLCRELEAIGFEWIDDSRMQLVERIRTAVIELVHYSDPEARPNLSDYLADRCHREYSLLSKLFSEVCGVTIERYCILQKIERVKELLIYGERSIAEIADLLGYSSAAHLSAQFRSVTGMTPSEFRRRKPFHRLLPLDKV